MTDPIRAGSSPWMREMQRLHAQQQAANDSKDAERIRHAAEEMALFLLYAGNGRLDEWLARQREGGKD